MKKTTKTNYLYLALFILGFGLRWYKLPDQLFFGFEQGRDALVAIDIAHLKDFVLVGPKTDLAGIFHGAWYYYLLAIPYFLSKGNPLFASLILVLINALIPLIFYKLIIEQTKSKKFALLGAIAAIFSLELITYSRWLSNVSPAPILVLLTFFSLWQYHKSSKYKNWLMAIFYATLASQFQIILTIEFVFVFAVFLISKFIKLPDKKTIIKSAAIILGFFTPMLLFNLRNKFVIFSSIRDVLTGGSSSGKTSFFNSMAGYGEMIIRLIDNTFSFSENKTTAMLFVLLLLIGLMIKTKGKKKLIFFFSTWTLMSLPVIFFSHSLNLEQLYLGSALGLIGLTIISIQNLIKSKKMALIGIMLIGFIFIPMPKMLKNLYQNKGMFFITIQDDLNYQDQKHIFDYINQDSLGNPYRLKSFTIPYHQEEAWQYLLKFYSPNHTDLGAKYIYVTIEEKVEPFWQEKWIEDLGDTNLVNEELFGRILVQKREIIN